MIRAFLIAMHLAAAAGQVTPTVTTGASVRWDYDVVDEIVGVTTFVVCLDGQPTANCAQVATSTGVVTVPGTKTYSWKLPPLLAGPHVVQIQACTDGAAVCSDGATLRFTFAVITNPKNLRIGGTQ